MEFALTVRDKMRTALKGREVITNHRTGSVTVEHWLKEYDFEDISVASTANGIELVVTFRDAGRPNYLFGMRWLDVSDYYRQITIDLTNADPYEIADAFVRLCKSNLEEALTAGDRPVESELSPTETNWITA